MAAMGEWRVGLSCLRLAFALFDYTVRLTALMHSALTQRLPKLTNPPNQISHQIWQPYGMRCRRSTYSPFTGTLRASTVCASDATPTRNVLAIIIFL